MNDDASSGADDPAAMKVAPVVPPSWMHKCQMSLAFEGTHCGSAFSPDGNDFDEFAGRVSAAGKP